MAKKLITPDLVERLVDAISRHGSLAAAARECGLAPKIVWDWLYQGSQHKRGLMHELYVRARAVGYKPRRETAKPMSQTKPKAPKPHEAERLKAVLRLIMWIRQAAPWITTGQAIAGVLAAVNRGDIDLTQWAVR